MTLKQIDESVFEENDMGVVKKDTLLEEGCNDEVDVDEKKLQDEQEVAKFKGLHTEVDENETEKDADNKKKCAAKKPIPLPRPKK